MTRRQPKMYPWTILVFIIVVAHCKPQHGQIEAAATYDEGRALEIQRNTKEILEKIARVNAEQGLERKPQNIYPPFRWGDSRSGFKFPTEPFSNPILEYVERSSNEDDNPPNQMEDETQFLRKAPEENYNEDAIPGQFIKRKITHQQTVYLTPNFQYQPVPGFPGQLINNPQNIYQQGPMGKQFQSPLSQYFPILIKDPLIQMYNAFTSMIEYGQGGGGGGGSAGCKKPAPPKRKTRDVEVKNSTLNNTDYAPIIYTKLEGLLEKNSTLNNTDAPIISTKLEGASLLHPLLLPLANTGRSKRSLHYEIKGNSSPTVTVDSSQNDSSVVFDIEGLTIRSNSDRQTKDNLVNNWIQKFTKNTSEVLQNPPDRDQIVHDEEDGDSIKGIEVSHDGNKKLFSKDNIGSGIFIHKLKVRKGGVAIAGPGGIATAGSGGTAIVGPNGFAYTHPDSLAIAGSGTKVLAVEPFISLTDIVNESSQNRSRGQGHVPRVGKIVAVGPVVYYNKG